MGEWKQRKCPSNDEYIKKVYIYSGILLGHKKEGSFATCNRIVILERSILSEINQTEKDKCHTIAHLHVESKKCNKIVNITEKVQTHR